MTAKELVHYLQHYVNGNATIIMDIVAKDKNGNQYTVSGEAARIQASRELVTDKTYAVLSGAVYRYPPL